MKVIFTIFLSVVCCWGKTQDIHLNDIFIYNSPQSEAVFGKTMIQNENILAISATGLNNRKGGVLFYKKVNNSLQIIDSIIAPPTAPYYRFGTIISLHKNQMAVKSEQDKILLYKLVDGIWTLQSHAIFDNTTITNVIIRDSTIIAANRLANNNYQGEVNIFELVNSIWVITQTINADNPTDYSHFGSQIELTSNADILIVGNIHSQVTIYNRMDSGWVDSQSLVPSDLDNVLKDGFGSSLKIKGNYLLVGAPNYKDSRGRAYIFENINGTWQEIKVISNPRNHIDEFFGISLAIQDSTFIIGAHAKSSEFEDYTGFVQVLQKNGNQWQSQIISPPNLKHDDGFGWDVVLHKNELLISAPYSDSLYENSGSVYVYQRDTTTGVFALQPALNNSFSVYPNPSSNAVTVRLSGVPNNKQVELYNSLGQLVLEQLVTKQTTTIPVAHLPNGVYHLRYNNQVETILINH